MPTFMINIHKIDDVKDAEAYIARLRAFPKLFDQLLVNLKAREEKKSGGASLRFSACARRLPQGHPGETVRFRA